MPRGAVLRRLPGRTRYAEHGGLRIAYELRGRRHRRRPWLVLVQGLGFDRSGWDPVTPGLARRFRLVLVDNRGSGRSEATADSFTVTDMARDVAAVLDHAGIRAAHVAGISLGGMVVQELAVEYPERVGRLVLAATTPGWPIAFPMPRESLRLLAETRGMTWEQALRPHVRNALGARAVA
jgi:3-oxoadipate enol-lactonase